jgi:hypothetical protein
MLHGVSLMILMTMITVRSSRREEEIEGEVKKNKKER